MDAEFDQLITVWIRNVFPRLKKRLKCEYKQQLPCDQPVMVCLTSCLQVWSQCEHRRTQSETADPVSLRSGSNEANLRREREL